MKFRRLLPLLAALSVPFPAQAQTLADRVEGAISAGRHSDAVVLLREMSVVDGMTLRIRALLAQELFAAHDYAGSLETANACVNEARRTIGSMAEDLRANCAILASRAQHELPPAPPVAPVPSRTIVMPVRTRTVPGPRSYAPSAPAVGLLLGGGVALAVSGVFAGLSASSLSGCTVTGDRAVCANETERTRARASVDYTTAANVTIGLGTVLVIGGAVTWIVTAALRHPEPVTITVGADGTIGVAGRF